MSTQLQLRRGTTAEVGAMTPAAGEPIVDTDRKSLRLGDGSEAGGFEIGAATAAEKTANYTADAADKSANLVMNKASAITLALTAAATLGSGWFCYVTNIGAGELTIDPASSETIDGATTITLSQNTGKMIVCDGAKFQTIGGGGGGGAFESALFHVQDEKSSGTEGGTFTSGAWRTRDLNTSKTNEITSASLSSNQISLPAGDYWVEAAAVGNQVSRHQTRIYDATNTTTLALGVVAGSDAGDDGMALSHVAGRFTLAGTASIELQHRCQTTKADGGFGGPGAWGTEVYSHVKIWKVG
jgi:hypothetical protein